MFLFYFSVGLAVLGTLLYHVAQKVTPEGVSPFLAIALTYVLSLAICVVILFFTPMKSSLVSELQKTNWGSYALAIAIVSLEIGFLLAYRAGWNMSMAAIFVNALGALLLVPIGMFFFKEHINPVNILGILVCIAGLVMLNWK